MNVNDAIRMRKSVRRYRGDDVEEEKLAQILESARLAPSASNRQEWRFVVVRDETRRRQLANAANQQGVVRHHGRIGRAVEPARRLTQ